MEKQQLQEEERKQGDGSIVKSKLEIQNTKEEEELLNNKEEEEEDFAICTGENEIRLITNKNDLLFNNNDDAFFERLLEMKLKSIKLLFPQKELPKKFGKLEMALSNSFDHLKKFKLIVRDSNMTVFESSQLGKLISQFKNLNSISLSLRGNKIGDKGACSILRAIESLPGLTNIKLGFTGCQIEDETMKLVEKIVREKKNSLVKLQAHLGGNAFDGKEIIKLIDSLNYLQNLTHLSIFFDRLAVNGETIEALCRLISSLKSMTKFTTSILFSKCLPSDYIKLMRAFQNSENLHTISVSMRENYVFDEYILRNVALIPFKTTDIDFTFEFGTVNSHREKKVQEYMKLKLCHKMQVIAFNKHISPFIPLHAQQVLFDIAD